MSNKFSEALKAEQAITSVSMTEKGAIGYANTRSRLVDFFFSVGSMRHWSPDLISTSFAEAYAEDSARALECLFLVRDCRGGLGEKRVFNICFAWLIDNFPGDAIDLIGLIPEYGSWKSFFELTTAIQKNGDVTNKAHQVFFRQYMDDLSKIEDPNASISLLAKWMPSENTSSRETRRIAKYWREVLNLTPKAYRKNLSKLRQKLDVVERKMSANKWTSINYNTVPAKAGIIYNKAFYEHDEFGRQAWLESLKRNDGSAKINVAGLTVADLVHRYRANGFTEDPVIEAAWRKLVDEHRLSGQPDILPIIDGSGSMYSTISPNSSIEAIDVSIGLGLFLANINTGKFVGQCIEFGSHPEFYTVPTSASLLSQIKIALKHDDCGSTNFKAVFDLILSATVSHGLSQQDIPMLITFSDMEFDCAYYMRGCRSEQALMKIIEQEYASAGFLLPKLIFWNINSRTNTIPLIENKLGVGLLSGFSQSIMDMILSKKLDPKEILLEKLDSARYDLVRKALQ